MKKAIVVAAAIWLGSAVLAAGIGNAYFSAEYPSANCKGRKELSWNIGMGLIGGPFALLAAFFYSGFAEHGWSLKLIDAENCKKKIIGI